MEQREARESMKLLKLLPADVKDELIDLMSAD
jgi:hypothetical protein